MRINSETIGKFLSGGILSQIAFSKDDVKFYFEANETCQIKLTKISSVTIEPRSFDCPSGMSMHTQILWLVDEVFQFVGNKVLDFKIIENSLLAIQFQNGALAFKIGEFEIS